MTPTATAGTLRQRCRQAWDDDHGLTTTVAVVLLFPLTAALLLTGVQTVLWQHARTAAADAANQTAALVATGERTAAEADSDLTARLEAHPDLTGVDVDVVDNGQLVAVTVTAQAHGILVGTRTTIIVRTATPIEAWQPLP